jgi:hypothetical protein
LLTYASRDPSGDQSMSNQSHSLYGDAASDLPVDAGDQIDDVDAVVGIGNGERGHREREPSAVRRPIEALDLAAPFRVSRTANEIGAWCDR